MSNEKTLFNIFDVIEQTPSTNAKKKLIEQMSEEQLTLLEICFNPYRQYHIKKFEVPESSKLFKSDEESYNDFIGLIRKIEVMNSSQQVVDLVGNFLAKCNDQQYKYYSRIIRKDLKIGINIRLINQVHKKLIPKFDVMLASKYGGGTISEFPEEQIKRNFFQPKLDGFRVVYFADSNIFLGRSGKVIPNKNLQKKMAHLGIKGVFDGELYSHERTFSEIASIARTEDKPLPDDIKLVVWDWVSTHDWGMHKNTEPYIDRLANVKRAVGFANSDFLQAIPFTVEYLDTHAPAVGAGFYKVFEAGELKLMAKTLDELYGKTLALGYEGLMAKDMNAFYEWKRAKTMFKIKPEDYIDGFVIGVFEGTGKYEGFLGGLIVEVEIEGNSVDVRVGGGFSDKQREEFWNNPPINRWAEIKYTEVTKTLGGTSSLRHPRFVRLRDDK